MKIQYGKSTDLFGLKQNHLSGFNSQVSRYRKLCNKFLKNKANTENVLKCSLCGLHSSKAKPDVIIHGTTYYACPQCDLRFLKKRLSKIASDKFYSSDETLSFTHRDPKLTEKRISEIVMPKALWAVEKFKDIYGRNPKKIVDVGAGGGQFVYAAQKLGLEAYGVEPNEPSRTYCKKTFGINLEPTDFLMYAKKNSDIDIITFWMVLEHVPDFMNFFKAARNMFTSKKQGLLIVEVPRWSSLDTAVQRAFPDSVNRHLFPLSHIRIFSDSSLANAFVKSGFTPKAAWYFGMDMYELTMQLARLAGENKIISQLGPVLLGLQPILDQGMLSDTMVFAGTPA